VKLINSPHGRNSDSANEQGSLVLDNDINELRKLAIGIVFLGNSNGVSK